MLGFGANCGIVAAGDLQPNAIARSKFVTGWPDVGFGTRTGSPGVVGVGSDNESRNAVRRIPSLRLITSTIRFDGRQLSREICICRGVDSAQRRTVYGSCHLGVVFGSGKLL